ncbi:hypothetical protein Scep_011668 [Stephania cephalantha]|uniref:DOG1 domain-containing protein n=1 Tax=Stephania cephalantha TaxID=152367 RepID=A0AAP0JEK7_9MAGN
MNFGQFYEIWLQQLHALLKELGTAPKPPSSPDHHSYLGHLVHRVISHYEDYYRVKSHSACTPQVGVFYIFSAPWLSSLERSLHWVAGWRPTTIFHLLYTETSARFEARLLDFLHGLRTGDLGDLSPSQLSRVSDLQCRTVSEENLITYQLGLWQESACDLVSLSRVDQDDPEIQRLLLVLKNADDLRLRTMKKVVEILTPQQAVEFLIAAAELQFGVRGWGLDKDQDRENRSS